MGEGAAILQGENQVVVLIDHQGLHLLLLQHQADLGVSDILTGIHVLKGPEGPNKNEKDKRIKGDVTQADLLQGNTTSFTVGWGSATPWGSRLSRRPGA